MSIQFMRGTSSAKSNSTKTLKAGQPFYETDTGKLYVASSDSTTIKNAECINPIKSATVDGTTLTLTI